MKLISSVTLFYSNISDHSNALILITRYFLAIGLLIFIIGISFGQKGKVFGIIRLNDQPTEFVTVHLKNTDKGTTSDEHGFYDVELEYGIHTLVIQMIGIETQEHEVNIQEFQPNIKLDIDLIESAHQVNEVVVTGTKTFKRKTDSPVIVNVLDSKTLGNLQVCNMSEGLKFQPGLRVETDCQTCGYTQLRMNGLAGGYSQILINGRPIFSPLMSLYGMELLPVNMIERIEIVRGGGSSLYGTSAIAGTVNVITKLPKKNTYDLSVFNQWINGRANDLLLTANSTWVNAANNAGIAFVMNHRSRASYDANGDNFSELPQLRSTVIGTNIFFKPSSAQKIELSLNKMDEYRLGGEMVNKPAFLAQQSEERDHDIWMGNIDYQLNFNQDNSSFIAFGAFQNTKRKHYTGIFPDENDQILAHITNPPYGYSLNTTIQGGIQINHRLNNFLGGKNVLTIGSEYIFDKINDQISKYRYSIDQNVKDWGSFFQSDWQVIPKINLLSGIRIDQHNLLKGLVWSPRFSVLYKPNVNVQLRMGYGTGFRAPQAFDTDLHIAFAGGGVSRVRLDPNLTRESSKSISASINYDKTSQKMIYGFTLEGFYTDLSDAFILENTGVDSFGNIFLKTNGEAAKVAGITTELRYNLNKKIQLESGLTWQSSTYAKAVNYIQDVTPIRNFIRTPNVYGFANLNGNITKILAMNVNYVYTGKMKLVHFAGAEGVNADQITESRAFSEISAKLSYTIHLHNKYGSDLEVFGGIKNIMNAYQDDFDKGKNRDSNYVYGPSLPRTIYIGFKLKAE